LVPPPTGASAGETASAVGTATARTIIRALIKARVRCENIIAYPSIPGRGKALLTWELAFEKEARSSYGGCGARSRATGVTIGPRASRPGHGFLHLGHQLTEREWLWQERELLIL